MAGKKAIGETRAETNEDDVTRKVDSVLQYLKMTTEKRTANYGRYFG